MNRKIFALSLLLGCGLSAGAQDYFWTPSGDRYKAAESIRLDGADSVVFRNNRLQVYRDGSPENWMYSRVLSRGGVSRTPESRSTSLSSGTSSSATIPSPPACRLTFVWT